MSIVELRAFHAGTPKPKIAFSEGMVVIVYKGTDAMTQFPNESAARFFHAAYNTVPMLLERIAELEKCSDPALIDRLVQDIAARRLENEKLAARVKLLEDQVAIEVNLRTKAQVRVRNALKVLAKLAEAAKRADALEGELAKARADLDSVLPSVRENLETISKQETLLQKTMETCRVAVSERDAAREGLRKAYDELMICGSKQSDHIRSKYLGEV